jgi:hypothetical protein
MFSPGDRVNEKGGPCKGEAFRPGIRYDITIKLVDFMRRYPATIPVGFTDVFGRQWFTSDMSRLSAQPLDKLPSWSEGMSHWSQEMWPLAKQTPTLRSRDDFTRRPSEISRETVLYRQATIKIIWYKIWAWSYFHLINYIYGLSPITTRTNTNPTDTFSSPRLN